MHDTAALPLLQRHCIAILVLMAPDDATADEMKRQGFHVLVEVALVTHGPAVEAHDVVATLLRRLRTATN